ncbi:MAG: bifunctional DedA family/phosphatase PAP2 family protein [Actinomycetota bacterium]|nr:bifunctional DedA family/phosphatase PAP2 family protein [Actinomycetota bacterium]
MSHLGDTILGLRGWVALAVIFAVPALESSAFLGFLFPGEIAVLLGGVLAFQHRVSLPAAIAAAVAGAIIGDTVGFEVGKHFGRRLLHGTIGRIVKPEHLDRAERYLSDKGGKAVFLGRFTAALRVMIPGMAGMAGMEYRTFAVYNVAGGTIWATSFVLAGYAGGSSYRHVESVAKKASLLLFLLVVVVVATFWAARRVARNQDRIRAFAERQANRPRVARLRGRYRRQLDYLARRLHPEGALGLELTASLALIALAGWALGAVTQDVLAAESLNAVDRPVLGFFVQHRETWLTSVNTVVTALGSSGVVIPLVVIVGLAWWARRRSWQPAAMLGGAYLGAEALFRLVKILVGRPRPPLAQAVGHFSASAFPSGHTTLSVAVYGMLAALLAADTATWARTVMLWAAAVFLAVLVGATRLYLGSDWFTDVIGGLALGSLWLFSLLAATRTAAALRATNRAAPDDGPAADSAVPADGLLLAPRTDRQPPIGWP